jgi:hypothetical protein
MEESFKIALRAYFLYRLAKLDYLGRIAGTLGFICGAIAEARILELTITTRAMTEWALGGCFLTAVLFQREIKELLR